MIFIPGSLADYFYWKDQVQAFSAHYRAMAYSRRYDYPNQNPARAGYSAIADAGTPILLMGGTASYPFLITISEILSSLLPHDTVLWIPGAGHQMWYQYPSLCRNAAQQFIRAQK